MFVCIHIYNILSILNNFSLSIISRREKRYMNSWKDKGLWLVMNEPDEQERLMRSQVLGEIQNTKQR